MSTKDASSPSGSSVQRSNRRKSQIQESLEVTTPRRKRSSADVLTVYKSTSRRESSDR